MHDGPLDMRMSSEGKSAKDIINEYSENELAEIFFKYGEEKLSRVIAKNIKKESIIKHTKSPINHYLILVGLLIYFDKP